MASQLAPQSTPPVASLCQQQSSCHQCSSIHSRIDTSLVNCSTVLDSSCSACLYSSQTGPYLEYHQLPLVQPWTETGRRPPPLSRSRSRNTKSGRYGARPCSSSATTNSTSTVDRTSRRGRNRPKTGKSTNISHTANNLSAEPRLDPSLVMPSTLASQSNSGQQYLSAGHGTGHQFGGKSPASYNKSYRYLLPSQLSYPHPSMSPQLPDQSNMWQSHLLQEPTPLLASIQALPITLATQQPATLSGSPYGTEMGSLGTTTIATNGFVSGAGSGSVASSGSTTPLNGGNLHQQHQQAPIPVGPHPHAPPPPHAYQHHHQQHHHLFHPSPTVITAALNQTPTPILNSDDTYICCAYSPRCFIIQKVKPTDTSGTSGSNPCTACSSLQSPQSENSQTSEPIEQLDYQEPSAVSPPSTNSSCSGSSSAEVISVLEICSSKNNTTKSGQAPPLITPPPPLSSPPASTESAVTSTNSTSTTSDQPPLISVSSCADNSNHNNSINSLSIDENESAGKRQSGHNQLDRLIKRPEDESPYTVASIDSNNLDSCHRVKCHRETQQEAKLNNNNNKESPKKRNARSKANSKTSSLLSSPEKKSEPKGRARTAKGGEDKLGNLLANQSSTSKRNQQFRKSCTSSPCEIKLDKLFLPAFAVPQHLPPTSSTTSVYSDSSSNQTSTSPSSASSSPSLGSPTSGIASKHPQVDRPAIDCTGEHKQQSNQEDTTKDYDRCNVLGKSATSKCDNDYDDDDSLLVVVKEEQKTTSGNQTKTVTVSDDAKNATGEDKLTDTKTCRDSGLILTDVSAKMETDIMENSYSSEASSICLNPAAIAIDPNLYDAGINCQMVPMNEVQLMDSMLSELSINGENNGGIIVDNDEIDAQLLPEDERPMTPSPANVQGLPMKELIGALRRQLEYYFSRENLHKDQYLLSQMDKDQYVPIAIVANFNEIKRLSNDFNLVVDALRSSQEVHVDESGLKVRPNSKRCVIILRDVPDEIGEESIKNMFEIERCPVSLVKCEFAHNSSWYLFFINDEDAQNAILFLKQDLVNYPGTSSPILARIKAKPIVQYRNKTLMPTPNVIRPIGIVTAPSPVGSTISSHSAAVSPVSSLSGSVNNPTVLMPNVTPPSSCINEAGTVNIAPYSASNVFTPYATNVPLIANNSRVYAASPFYPPSMLQLPSSNSPCYDLSTVFVANGLAPHTYSPGVVTSLTAAAAGGPTSCLSVATGGATQQQPSLQFIATSGSGSNIIANNSGTGSSNGGRYGGSSSGYGNNYSQHSHYSHHYNTYPKSHGGHHRLSSVSVNSNSGSQSNKSYRYNKYNNNSNSISNQHYQYHSNHHSHHYQQTPQAAYQHNPYVASPVVNIVSSNVTGATETGPAASSANIVSVSTASPVPSLSVTASSTSTNTNTSTSSTSAISNCVTTTSSKETIGQSQKSTSHHGKQQISNASHLNNHSYNQTATPSQTHHSGSSQSHQGAKSGYNVNSSANVQKPSESLPETVTKSANKSNTAITNGLENDRSSHSNSFSSRSNNQVPTSSSRSSGTRSERHERSERPPKSGSGYRGKKEYSTNYSSTSTPAVVSETDGNIIRKSERSERSGSGKFSRNASSGGTTSKSSNVSGTSSVSSSSKSSRNAQPVNTTTVEPAFNLIATAFPPLPGLNELENCNPKDSLEPIEMISNQDSQITNHVATSGLKSHESSLADVVKGNTAQSVLPSFTEAIANSDVNSSQPLKVKNSVMVNHTEAKPNLASSKSSHKSASFSSTTSVESVVVVNHKSELEYPLPSTEPIPNINHELQSTQSAINSSDLVNDFSVASSDYHNHVNHIGTESRTSRSSSLSLNRNDSSILNDFPLVDDLQNIPAVDVLSQSQSTLTYAQIAQRSKAAKLAAAANELGSGTTISSLDHSLVNSIANNATAAVGNHISLGAASNSSLRTRSIVK